jgi:hypothetical protein
MVTSHRSVNMVTNHRFVNTVTNSLFVNMVTNHRLVNMVTNPRLVNMATSHRFVNMVTNPRSIPTARNFLTMWASTICFVEFLSDELLTQKFCSILLTESEISKEKRKFMTVGSVFPVSFILRNVRTYVSFS